MSTPCDRWMALSDRVALDEGLRDDERAFLTQHGASCPACGRERAVWDDLGRLLHDEELPRERSAPQLAALPSTVRSAPHVTTARPRPLAHAAWAAALLLLAVGGASVTLERPARPGAQWAQPPPQAVVATPTARAVAVHLAQARAGTVELDGKVCAEGAELHVGSELFARAGAACLTVEPGVRACLAEGGRLRVATLSASERRLELLAGKLSAELLPQPAGTSFGIVTHAGSAIAVGTAFTVEVPALGGAVVTRVLHGTVLVRSRAGREQRLTAHRATAMDGEPSGLTPTDEARERAFLEQPLAAAPAVSVEALPDEAPASVPRAPARTAKVPLVKPTESARGLLVRAREARAAGDARAAEAAYGALLERHPASSEAQAARVPLGELLLSAGAAEGALASFERYLQSGGPLAEEASFGRARALRALGDEAGEQAALGAFLQTYPDSPLCDALRARAKTLEVR